MNFCLHGSARTVEEAVDRAKRAEALGFEAIFFADSQMNNVDPYQAMALCAVNTKKIRFGTAVTNMVYRDPTITACSFATLNEISKGRAIVGMGTGDGPVYSLGRTATKLVEFEKGLRVIRDLLHDRGIDVPKSKERARRQRQIESRQASGADLYFRRRTENLARRRPHLRWHHSRHRFRQAGHRLGAPTTSPRAQKTKGEQLEDIDIMPAGMIVVDDDGDLARRRVR